MRSVSNARLLAVALCAGVLGLALVAVGPGGVNKRTALLQHTAASSVPRATTMKTQQLRVRNVKGARMQQLGLRDAIAAKAREIAEAAQKAAQRAQERAQELQEDAARKAAEVKAKIAEAAQRAQERDAELKRELAERVEAAKEKAALLKSSIKEQGILGTIGDLRDDGKLNNHIEHPKTRDDIFLEKNDPIVEQQPTGPTAITETRDDNYLQASLKDDPMQLPGHPHSYPHHGYDWIYQGGGIDPSMPGGQEAIANERTDPYLNRLALPDSSVYDSSAYDWKPTHEINDPFDYSDAAGDSFSGKWINMGNHAVY